MRSFNEWQEENNQHENPDLLVDRLDKLADLIEQELKSFTGDRFDGMMKILGAHKDLKRTLAEIKIGSATDQSVWHSK